MNYIQVWLLLWQSLFSQSIPFPGPGRAPTTTPPAFVAATSASFAGATSGTTVSPTRTTTIHNSIVAASRTGLSGTCGTSLTAVISDTGADTFSTVVYSGVSGVCLAFAYAKDLAGTTNNQVTFQWKDGGVNSGFYDAIVVFELSNTNLTAPEDATFSASTTSLVSSITSSTFSTATANEIIIAAASAGGGTHVADTGYTIPTNGQDPSSYMAMEYKIVSSIQSSVTVSMSFPSNNGAGIIGNSMK